MLSYEEKAQIWRYYYELRFGPWEISVLMALPFPDVAQAIDEMMALAQEWVSAYAKITAEAIARMAAGLEKQAQEDRYLN